MSTSGGRHEKASITNLDDQRTLQVQFNPAHLQFSDAARWEPQGNQTRPTLAYASGSPATLRLDLQFDGTRGGVDVDERWVRGLRELLEQRERPTRDGQRIARPPHLQFTWGAFRFYCVLSSIEVRYLMFRPDGAPVRAEVGLVLIEQDGDAVEGGQGAAPGASAGATTQEGARVVAVRPGQTLAAVAHAAGCTLRDLARANGLDDPLAVEAGTRLLVPASQRMADVMERRARSVVRASWSDDEGPEPRTVPGLASSGGGGA